MRLPASPSAPARSLRREELATAGRDAVMGPGEETAGPVRAGREGDCDTDGTDARDDKSRGADIAKSRPDSAAPLEHSSSAARCASRMPAGGPVARISFSVQPHANNLQLSTPLFLNHARSSSYLSTRRASSGVIVGASSTGDEGCPGVKTATSTGKDVEEASERLPPGMLKDSRCPLSRIASLSMAAMS